MSVIIDFFAGLGDAIKAAFQFLIDIVQDLIYVVMLIGDMAAEIPNLIGWLPASCIALLLTLFSVVVIYKILGRD